MVEASSGVDRVGVHAAGLEFSRRGWAYRELATCDFGIDALVEPVTSGRPSSNYIALQIKSDKSWLKRSRSGDWVFREKDDKHLLYWLRCRQTPNQRGPRP